MPKRKLTLKERAFIKETIATRNPTEAIRRVYNIGSKGGSKTKRQEQRTSSAMASKKLSNVSIKEKIEKYLPDELIFGALEEDIKNKPRNRCAELQLASKIKGLLSDKIDITSKDQQITGFNYIKPNKEATESLETSENKKDE